MCGIFFGERSETFFGNICDLLQRRGPDYYNKLEKQDFLAASSVLAIRGTVPQPVETENFSFLYNGEIYNESPSDTLFIKNTLLELYSQRRTNNPELEYTLDNFYIPMINDLVTYIDQYENEMALVIILDKFVFFYKDYIGKRSLGYNMSPFVISSVGYDNEMDPMSIYCYNLKTKELKSWIKPPNYISRHYNMHMTGIRQFLTSEKYQDRYAFLSSTRNGDSEIYGKEKSGIDDEINSNKPHDTIGNPTGIENVMDPSANNESFTMSIVDTTQKYFDENVRYASKDAIESDPNASISIQNLSKSVQDLIAAGVHSVKRRIHGSNIVIAFSGGVDSLFIAACAHLAADPNCSIYLINTAFCKSSDRQAGLKAHEALQSIFPSRKFVFIENNISQEEVLEHKTTIYRLIYPKTGRMDFNIGATLFFSSKAAQEFSKVMLLGSGADELFGGYSKYKNAGFRSNMLFDLYTMSSHNLCRDDRIISHHGVEGRFPFLDSAIIKISFKIEDSLLIKDDEGCIQNKYILREALRKLGLGSCSMLAKKAMQYGTGISKLENILFGPDT